MNISILESSFPRLCFVHVPKTAGSSLNEFFSEIYGEFKLPAHTTIDYKFYTQAQLNEYLFYSGHCYWRDYRRLPPDTRLFTVFRNPVARVISLYQYWGAISVDYIDDETMAAAMYIARSSSIYEFISSKNAFIREAIVCGQVRQFLRPNLGQHVELLCNTDTGQRDIITQVYDTLSNFEAVMTVERLPDSLRAFLRKLGLIGYGTFPHLNPSPRKDDIDLDRVKDLLLDLSYVDFAIYEAAQSLEARLVEQVDDHWSERKT